MEATTSISLFETGVSPMLPCRELAVFPLLVLLWCAMACEAGERKKVLITSSKDGTEQPSYIILPDGWQADTR